MHATFQLFPLPEPASFHHCLSPSPKHCHLPLLHPLLKPLLPHLSSADPFLHSVALGHLLFLYCTFFYSLFQHCTSQHIICSFLRVDLLKQKCYLCHHLMTEQASNLLFYCFTLQENTWQITNKILCKDLEESCLEELLCEKQISVLV